MGIHHVAFCSLTETIENTIQMNMEVVAEENIASALHYIVDHLSKN